MGILNRLFNTQTSRPPTGAEGDASMVARGANSLSPVDFSIPGRVDATLYEGHETLEVVGESYRQDALWRLIGGPRNEAVHEEIVALLVPEPENQYDPNAIRVLIGGQLVGYLSRSDAAAYLPGLKALIEKSLNGLVALSGSIVGGGTHADGRGQLGVFLDHNPVDFGIKSKSKPEHATLTDISSGFGFRTGLSSARATDAEDDSYDLSWLDGLSTNVGTAIQQLRKLLGAADDPIDRHFMFAELEHRLYACRGAFASALDEYDEVCRQHDEAMEEIRAALLAKFGQLPVLDTYRQAAIRCQQAQDWEAVRRWAERGLSIYGANAAKPSVVEDLRKRLAHAMAKIDALNRPKIPRQSKSVSTEMVLETLTCQICGSSFERVRTPGRKPHSCPSCRGL